MSVQVSTCIDEATKLQFDKICEIIGISPSNALSMFIKGVINYNGIPFNVVVQPENVSKIQKKAVRPPFEYGSMSGKIWMADDFDAPQEKVSNLPFGRGCMKGKMWMADDFDAPLEDFKEYME